MALEVHRYRVEGISSLLMHSPQAMMEGRTAGPTTKTIPTPEEEAEKGVYRDEEGCLYLPSAAFKASLLHGAGGRRLGKTAARTIVAGGVFATQPRTYLVDPESRVALREYRVHVARVVVQRNSILRARPEIPRWGCVVEFEVDLELVQPWQVEELMNISGRISGVGDFRPQCKGPHGRYRVKLLEDYDTGAATSEATSEAPAASGVEA